MVQQVGALNNDPTGQDSISYRFQVQLTDDCLLLQCDGTLTGAANIYGFGDISGNTQTNDGASALLDANGCPVEEVTTLEVQTGVCPPVAIEPVGTTCLGDDVALEVPAFMDNPWRNRWPITAGPDPMDFPLTAPRHCYPTRRWMMREATFWK